MKLLLNTNLVPLFHGTYNTMWEVYECDDDGEEVGVDFEFKDLIKSIQEVYQGNASYIVGELEIPWITKINFTGNWSPREYNFNTDQLDFELTINKNGMLKALKDLKYDPEFENWLHDNYTSYDGFISFTPNNYNELEQAIKEENSDYHQAMSALITYLCKDKLEGIEYDIYSDWQGNGYGGLDYTISDDNE